MVPYVRLSPHTRAAVDAYDPVYVETPGPFGYIDALEQAWSTGQGFCLVEQDKVPWPGALEQLWACPGQWCVFPCPTRNGSFVDFPTLATVKFSTDMIQAHPNLMQWVRTISVGDRPAGFPLRLDMAIYDIASRLRIAPHWHGPAVDHRHEEDR